MESINREIDRCYSLHAKQLAARGHEREIEAQLEAKIADAKAEIIKWTVGTMFVAVALFATIMKLWQ